jgi:hypothetical protein
MWKVTDPKLNIIWNILMLFLAHKLSTICPSLINSKCEKLSTVNVRTCEYLAITSIFYLSYKWLSPPIISPIKNHGPKRKLKKLILLIWSLIQNNKERELIKVFQPLHMWFNNGKNKRELLLFISSPHNKLHGQHKKGIEF